MYAKRKQRDHLIISVVNLSAMSNTQNQNYYFAILNLSDQSIIAYTISPLAATIIREPFPVLPRIGASFKIFPKPPCNKRSHMLVQLFELSLRLFR